MRTTVLSVHNDQAIEIFVKRCSDSSSEFEIWIVGVIKGQRHILDHFITLDDVEKTLSYSEVGDVVWEDGNEEFLPILKTEVAIAREEVMARGILSEPMLRFYNAIHQLPINRKTWNAAKKALVGQWTDQKATLVFKPDSKLQMIYPAHALHPHFVRVAAQVNSADWWNASSWWLFLMNEEKLRGQKIGMWRCDEQQLHLFNSDKDAQGVLVHVFFREASL